MSEPVREGRSFRPLLSVERLSVAFGGVTVVRDVALEVHPGECVGIVGASGAGKTVTALSFLGLLPSGAEVLEGRVALGGRELLGAPQAELRAIRGREVGMVFQDALGALHPAMPVVDQVAEAFVAHRPGLGAAEARERALKLLAEVGIDADRATASRYPHEWSGGMRQRALIAIAIANRPALVVADEPTTALDVTTQARVLDLLRRMRERTGAALLLITHDLGVISETAERVYIMQDGRIIESGRTEDVFRSPSHEHTRELLDRDPGRARGPLCGASVASRPASASPSNPPAMVLRAEDLTVTFPGLVPDEPVRAVDGVSLSLARSETLGVVGESGSGKTTLARVLVRLLRPDRGRVLLDGEDLLALHGDRLRAARSKIQIVFQDPDASLNPRRRVGNIIAQPLVVHGRRERVSWRVAQLLERVGLSPADAGKRPHQFSGGQRQRIAIARALALEPEVLILDEPVSALDTVVQARIMTLLSELRSELGLSLLLIAHDLALVRGVADRIGVMFGGKLVEIGPAEDVCERPSHLHTRDLLASIPRMAYGEVPDFPGRASRARSHFDQPK